MSDLHEAFENAKKREKEIEEQAKQGVPTSTCVMCHKHRDTCACKPNWKERESVGL